MASKSNVSSQEKELRLNLDVEGKVTELDSLLKKVLPRNIVWTEIQSRGLEFDGYRDYTDSDDAINIDWKASRRTSKLLVKKYIEEKDRRFLFFVDVSENMVFGSNEKLKCEYAAEITAALAHRILAEGDRVGFILYNEKVVAIRNPDKGNRQFDIFVDNLSNARNYSGTSNLNNVLDILIPQIDHSTSLIFLVSDFINVDESYKKNLEIIGGLYETIAFIIKDPLDLTLPNIDRELVIEDVKTGERLLINPKVIKEVYQENSVKKLNELKKIFSDYGIDFLELNTKDNSSLTVAEFLKGRLAGGGKK